MQGFQVVSRSEPNTRSHRLVVSASSDLSSPSYGAAGVVTDGYLRLYSPTGLAAGKWYWGIERNGVLLSAPRGTARIPDVSFKFCFGSCAYTDSNAAVFAQIVAEDPDLFIHLGDGNYEDNNSSDEQVYLDAFSRMLAQANQALLFRNVAVPYQPDDHDAGGGNNPPGNTPAMYAAAAAWRRRVPYPASTPSGATEAHYYYFDIGRVRFIFLDMRTKASASSDTDNSSKTFLGATQKAWLSNLLQNSAGYGIVPLSTRMFHCDPSPGLDQLGGYTFERTEVCDMFKAYVPGRVISIVHGDSHIGALDSGVNCNYATGGDPLRCIVASPLDQAANSGTLATWSSGVFGDTSKYGLIEVVDGGGSTLDITRYVKNAAGSVLTTDNYTVDLS